MTGFHRLAREALRQISLASFPIHPDITVANASAAIFISAPPKGTLIALNRVLEQVESHEYSL